MYLAGDYIHPTPHNGRCRVRIYRPDLPEEGSAARDEAVGEEVEKLEAILCRRCAEGDAQPRPER